MYGKMSNTKKSAASKMTKANKPSMKMGSTRKKVGPKSRKSAKGFTYGK